LYALNEKPIEIIRDRNSEDCW